jgi:hypothetical protein
VHAGRLPFVAATLVPLLLQPGEYDQLRNVVRLNNELNYGPDGGQKDKSAAKAWKEPVRLVLARIDAAVARQELPRKFMGLVVRADLLRA